MRQEAARMPRTPVKYPSAAAVRLEPEVLRALRRLASRSGRTVSEELRLLVHERLTRAYLGERTEIHPQP
jgi:hypothetical protein